MTWEEPEAWWYTALHPAGDDGWRRLDREWSVVLDHDSDLARLLRAKLLEPMAYTSKNAGGRPVLIAVRLLEGVQIGTDFRPSKLLEMAETLLRLEPNQCVFCYGWGYLWEPPSAAHKVGCGRCGSVGVAFNQR